MCMCMCMYAAMWEGDCGWLGEGTDGSTRAGQEKLRATVHKSTGSLAG